LSILKSIPGINDSDVEKIIKQLTQSPTSDSPLENQLRSVLASTLGSDDSLFPDLNLLRVFNEQYRDNLISTVRALASNANPDLNQLFWMAFYTHAFLTECSLTSNLFAEKDLAIGTFLETHFSEFPSDLQQRIRYLSYGLGAQIARATMQRSAQDATAALQAKIVEATQVSSKITGWDTKLAEWNERTDKQEERLKTQLAKLNFVGISNAFSTLGNEKRTERNVHASLTFAVIAALLMLPTALLLAELSGNIDISQKPWLLAPSTAIEFLLIYLLRISLMNYASAKTQFLQFRLRYELCAFVEAYSAFIEPLRKQGGPETLAKFESIIFSGISPDPDKVPSTFDGAESLVNLIKELRSDK